MTDKQLILKALKHLQNKGPINNTGICCNVQKYMDLISQRQNPRYHSLNCKWNPYKLFPKFVDSWKESNFDFSRTYPIAGPWESANERWVEPNRSRRMSFIAHLIKCIKEM